jgi:hypothetical protein
MCPLDDLVIIFSMPILNLLIFVFEFDLKSIRETVLNDGLLHKRFLGDCVKMLLCQSTFCPNNDDIPFCKRNTYTERMLY